MTAAGERRGLSRPAVRAAVAVAALAVFAAAGLSAFFLPLDAGAQLAAWLERADDSAWAAPVGVAAFVALACMGAPQVVLITGLVAAFGPWAGFLYSWLAKVISCAVGFALGRRFGARALQRRAGPELTRTMDYLARRGFWASAVIRIVPTVPSVVVNLAAGCTPIRFRDYIAGTAVGSVPKMALTAFAGHAAISGLKGAGPWAWIALALAVALLGAIAWFGRHWARRVAGLAKA